MPTYRFQCGCGLNFTARADQTARAAPCPACKASAARDLPRQVNVAHGGSAGTAAPPSTGFSGVDFNPDRVIGEDARTKWTVIAQRQRDKIAHLENVAAKGKDLSRKSDGTYRVMTPAERAAKEAQRKTLAPKVAELHAKETAARLKQPKPR